MSAPADYDASKMRDLHEHEEVGLIGYPGDGKYIAMLDEKGRHDWLLGGELCELAGASLASQAAILLRYYPHGTRLVVVTIEGNKIIALQDYDAAQLKES